MSVKLDTASIVRAVSALASEHHWSVIPARRQTVVTGKLEGRSVTIQHCSHRDRWNVTLGFGGPGYRFDMQSRNSQDRTWLDSLFQGSAIALAHPQLEAKYILRTRRREVIEAKFSHPTLLNLLVVQSPALFQWAANKYGHYLSYRSDQSESAEASVFEALTGAFTMVRCFEL